MKAKNQAARGSADRAEVWRRAEWPGGADPSVRELITQYEDGDIIKPELQRNYVWDIKEASRFIES